MRLKSTLLNNRFLQHFISLFSGNAIAQVIPFLALPFISRLYSPSDFGVFGVFMSITAFVSVIINGRYGFALPQSQNKQESSSLLFGALLIGIVLTALLTILFYLFHGFVSKQFISEEVFQWIPYLFVSLLIIGLFQPLKYLAIHYKRFHLIAIYGLILSISNTGIRLLLGYMHVEGGLIYAFLISNLVSLLFISAFIFRELKKEYQAFEFQTMGLYLKKHIRFPLFNGPRVFINNLASSLPILILARKFGQDIAGIYTLSTTLIFKPVNLVSSSLNTLLYQRLAENKREGKNDNNFIRITLLLLITIGSLPFISFYFINESIITTILGEEWTGTLQLIRIIVPWLFMVLLTSPFSFTPDLYGRQKTALYLDIVYSIVRIGGLLLASFQGDWKIAIMAYSISAALFLVILLYWYRSLIYSHAEAKEH